jgi:hypothetical protein
MCDGFVTSHDHDHKGCNRGFGYNFGLQLVITGSEKNIYAALSICL